MQKIPEGAWRKTVIAVVFLLVAVFALHSLADFDVWFHLKGGEYINKNLSVPHKDPFSYTASNNPYIDSHWLFQLILFYIFNIFGISGLIVFKSLLLFFTFFIIFRIGYKPHYYLLSIFFLLVCLFNTRNRFLFRPEIVTFLLIGIYIFILQGLYEKKHSGMYLLPLLQVIWVNCHGLFVLGPVIVGIYCIGSLLSGTLGYISGLKLKVQPPMPPQEFALCWKIFFICIAACFINPYGIVLIKYSLRLFTEIGSKASFFMRQVQELKSPATLAALDLFFYRLLIALCIGSFLLNYKKINLTRIILFLAFSFLSLLAVRNIALLAIVCMPVMVLNMQEALESGLFIKLRSFRPVKRLIEAFVLLGTLF